MRCTPGQEVCLVLRASLSMYPRLDWSSELCLPLPPRVLGCQACTTAWV